MALSNCSRRLFLLALGAVLSVALMVAVSQVVRRLYRREMVVRLDPTSAQLMAQRREAEASRLQEGSRIVYFGDSRIEFWDIPNIAGAQALNRGRGGETSAQALLRVERDVLSAQPDVVVLQLGANDLKAIGVLPELADRIVQGCVRNITEIVEILTSAGVTVVWMPIFPVGPVELVRRLVWSERTIDAIEAVNRQIAQLHVENFHIVDTDRVLARDGRMRPEFAADALHVSPLGYAELAKLLSEALPPIVDAAHKP